MPVPLDVLARAGQVCAGFWQHTFLRNFGVIVWPSCVPIAISTGSPLSSMARRSVRSSRHDALGGIGRAIATAAATLLLVLGLLPLDAAWAIQPSEVSNRDVAVDLSGAWKSRKGDDLRWAEPDYDDTTWSATPLPSTWAEQGYDGVEGYVWFRRETVLPPTLEGAGVLVGAIGFANYELYADGVRIGSYGGPSSATLVPAARVFRLPPKIGDEGGRLVLALRVWRVGWASDYAGEAEAVGEPLELGRFSALRDRVELENLRSLRSDLDSLVLAVVFTVIGIYQLLLYRSRALNEYLWYSLTTFSFAAKTFFLSPWVYQLTDQFGLVLRLGSLSSHLIAAASIQFLWTFASLPIGKLLRAYQLSQLAIALLIAVIPNAGLIVDSQRLRSLWLLPLLIAVVVLVARTWRRHSELRTISVGLLFVVSVELYQLLAVNLGWEKAESLAAWAFAVLALSMAVSLSNRFSRVHGDLRELQKDLEGKVDQRTEEVQESERRYRDLFASAGDLIQSLDAEGRIVYVNPQWCKTLGYTEDEACQLSFQQIIAPEHLEKCMDIFATLSAGHACPDIETVFLAKDGRKVFVEGSSSPRIHEGRVVATQGFFRDVTRHKRAEEALRSSETRYRDLVENMRELICTHDMEGRLLSANRAFLKVAGRAHEEELVGRRLSDFLTAESRALFPAYLDKVAKEGRAQGFMKVVIPNGEERTLEYDNTLGSEGLETPIVRGVARDVTERRRLEQEIKRQKALLECQSEAVADGILVVSERRKWVSYNQRFLDMWGLSDEVARAGSSELAMKTVLPMLAKPEEFLAGVDELYENRERIWKDEVPLTDGRVFERHTAPVRGNDGRYYGRLWSYRDITERKRDEDELSRHRAQLADMVAERTAELTVANERLQESEASLARAQEIAHLGSWEWDIVNNKEHWSDEVYRVFGVARESFDPSYDAFLDCVHPDDRQLVRRAHDDALNGKKAYSIYHRIRRPDGTVRKVHEQAEVTFDDSGKPVRMIGTAQDVTEHEALEERLRHAQKMEAVGRLAAGIAHDFNNLLMVIQGYGEQLVNRFHPDDPDRLGADEILRASRRAASLTRQLLVFTRKDVLQLTIMDVNTIVADTETMLGRLIGENIELVTVLDAALGAVRADRGQIEQIIVNLAVNARDAMPAGGKLTIKTSNVELDAASVELAGASPGPYVLLEVSDTGVGMDAETLSSVFEPFFTTKEQGEGTGLGLATVYGITRQSGGCVFVESDPGQGAVFRIYLPRVGTSLTDEKSELPLEGALAGSETILVVEDEANIRSLVGNFLRSKGYKVLVAEDGQEGLRIGNDHVGPIDLLMTDVVMPGMAGPELAAQVQSRRPETKVLYMSGYMDDSLARLRVNDGSPPPLLPKPFSLVSMASSIREMLDEGRK